MEPRSFEDVCGYLRTLISDTAGDVQELMDHSTFEDEQPQSQDRGEMKANIMLAYRHLEDARMRLGKAIQAYDGGVSVYDK